jgi:phosphoribosylformylglycinamidine (FGAM) synthase-like enzyme
VSDQSKGEETILLYLIGGRELRLGVDPQAFASAFHDALTKREAIQIDDPSGGKSGINPRAILYWKPDTGSRRDRPD